MTFNETELNEFKKAQTFGVPIKNMKQFLALPGEDRDRLLKDYGVPCDSTDNQFKVWISSARATNRDLRIAIKADQNTPYSVIKNVMSSLQDLKENRYNLITSLKTRSDEN